MTGDIAVRSLTVEYQSNPMPLDIDRPRFGWQLAAATRGVMQLAYELRVATSPHPHEDPDPVWSSGRVESDMSVGVVYAGPKPSSRTRYYWTVRVWTDAGAPSAWAEAAWWETGLQPTEWQAAWIEPEQRPAQPEPAADDTSVPGTVYDRLNPAQHIRRTFTVRDGLTRARLYASAHGIYTVEINGDTVGNQELAPEPTAYQDILMYQAFDVTDVVAVGANAVGFTVADGWWAGRLGMFGTSVNYGDHLALIAQLELCYSDGRRDIVATDESFRSATAAIRYADLLIGEKHDARQEQIGWSTPDFDDTSWTPVNVADIALGNLRAQIGEPIRAVAEFPCVRAHPTVDGGQILDFGQLIAGRIRIRFTDLPAGTEIRFQHCSVLNPDGDYFDSINGHNNYNTDIYIARGGHEIFEPRLTYHAFRYVKVTGYPGLVDPATVLAIAISSDLHSDFTFRASDPRIEQLHSNVYWTLRDNLLSIPTDNPDRERAGWTGDLAVIAATAALYFGTDAFMTRYLTGLRAEQFDNGTVPMTVPFFEGYRALMRDTLRTYSCAAWGDAATIVPGELYDAYGDRRILEDSYDSCLRFHEYVMRTAAGTVTHDDLADEDLSFIWRAETFHFGDWLAPSSTEIIQGFGFYNAFKGQDTNDLVPTFYHIHSTDILADFARVLGLTADEARFRTVADRLRRGFRKAFIAPDGRLSIDTQSNYVLALAFRVSPDLDKTFVERLRELVLANDGLLDTGFLATAFLLPVLCDHGMSDLAYSILFSDRYPSWLHMLEHDATTIWETWEAINDDGTPNRVSYAQPGLSTVGLWLGRYVAGIRPASPGYRHILIHPVPGPGLVWAEGRYRSVRGEIAVAWRHDGTDLLVAVTIPPNATATVALDDARIDEILLDDMPVLGHPDVASTYLDDQTAHIEIGSGEYRFRYRFRGRPGEVERSSV